jgi:hypothetical protein
MGKSMRFYAKYTLFGYKIRQGEMKRNKDLIRRYHHRAVVNEDGNIIIQIGKFKIILT